MSQDQHTQHTQDYLTRPESAEFLTERGFKTAKGQLQKLASVGGGPRYYRFGHRVLYRQKDLLDWVQSRLKSCGGA